MSLKLGQVLYINNEGHITTSGLAPIGFINQNGDCQIGGFYDDKVTLDLTIDSSDPLWVPIFTKGTSPLLPIKEPRMQIVTSFRCTTCKRFIKWDAKMCNHCGAK